MNLFFSAKNNTKNLTLNILFLLSGTSLLLFYRNMFYLHIIVISLMILMLIKCYFQGIRNGLIWLGFVTSIIIILMFKDSVLTKNELSEILLILAPSITVGVLGDKQRRHIKQLKETYLSTLKALAEATDSRDSYTQGHSERVARYAVLIAKELSLSEDEMSLLEQAALLHDIGKIAIPDNVLNKTGPLDGNDWLIMKRHPEYSQRIISNLNFLSGTIPAILYHHKRFDNKGYPFGRLDGNMPVTAGILAVADAFDAMTSDRPYRNKLSLEQALEELEKCSGTQFDPNVVKALKRVNGLQMKV
jgi:HD-GYP domain-containing protein (c-di-GMP phosphodiesterase class II)